MPAPALVVSELHRRFGERTAVDHVSLEVARGEIVGLLGPNGAGKTTTINMLLGVLAPTSGSVEIDGIDLGRDRRGALEHTNFAAVYSPLPGNLTVIQNLRVFGRMYGVADLAARIEALLDELDLRQFRDTKCGVLSSGEQTRAGLAKALLNRPSLLLLDEPTASLDPSTAREIRGTLRDLATHCGAGVLWTSHNMYEVEDVCDRALFLLGGKIVLEGDPRTLPRERGMATLEDLFVSLVRAHHAPPA